MASKKNGRKVLNQKKARKLFAGMLAPLLTLTIIAC